MVDPSDRRQNPRYPYYAKVVAAETALGYLRNLSKIGAKISVICEVPYSVGDILRLRTIPAEEGAPALSTQCEVMWSRLTGPYSDMGVSFQGADEATREKVARFADYLEERSGLCEVTSEIQIEVVRRPPKA